MNTNVSFFPGVTEDVLKNEQTALPEQSHVVKGKVLEKDSESAGIGEASLEDIYPDIKQSSDRLLLALKHMRECMDLLERALKETTSGDVIAADDCVDRVILRLPELFCFRDIGDGFGNVISAIFNGLINRKGEPLEVEKIIIMLRAFSKINKEPYISFEDSLDITIALESHFDIDPPTYKYLADFLSD